MNKLQGVVLLTMLALCQSRFKKYCNQKGCKAKTHVLCTHGHLAKGKNCKHKITDIPWDYTTRTNMLNMWNGQRMRLVRGVEIDKEKKLYPKAYGMARLIWNSELALIAGALVTQCINVETFKGCLATDTYPKPFTGSNILVDSIPHAIYWSSGSLKNCIIPKKRIEKYQDFSKNVKDFKGTHKFATRICFGFMGHLIDAIGCHSIFVAAEKRSYYVCIFSESLVEGKPVYLLSLPKGGTPLCGCLPGWRDTSGCLCMKNKNFGVTKSTKPYFGPARNYEPLMGPQVLLYGNEPSIIESPLHLRHSSTTPKGPYFILAFEVTPTPKPSDLDDTRKNVVDWFFNSSVMFQPDSLEMVTLYGEDQNAHLAESKRARNNIRRIANTELQENNSKSYNLTLLFDALSDEVTRNKPVGKMREYFDMKIKRIYNLLHKEDRHSPVPLEDDEEF